ncbi:GNAT family N-acetyltransferase [Chryseobacterium arthrosphaerae]|uniref:GNAT family N-acetyltransferase n=1 Tax=Chryseobacterium arthrosphaerae TaxID=651561 RepID=UPI001F4AAABE|nr:GNAT family N-acetyltransferase [Chryseobacterium arthrosphaerae]MDG4653508.1 GNAT family N-acetyltransferase [Chryseobacterium arthrosphaerae]
MSTGILNNASISIRKGSLNDLPAMQQLFADTIQVICKNDYNDLQRNAWSAGTDNEERWMNVIKGQYVLIAEAENQIVGFSTLDQGTYIDLLFVHKDHQHQGIASLLYAKMEEEALRHGQKQLTTDVSKTARPFFEKSGFRILKEQTVNVKGIDLINYKMIKNLMP